MVDLIQPHASAREADRRAREWLDALDHEAAVGSRHHVVPRFLLARFASPRGQIQVRNKADGAVSLRAISDLAVRDFYTAITKDQRLDSSLESLLSVVEGDAARILKRHLDARAFAKARAFTPEERATLDMFVSTQHVRGLRARRVLEVLTDYTVKLLNEDKLTDADIAETEFIPHPNEHLQMFGSIAERLETSLKDRQLSILWLDQPLLITGDEPVAVAGAASGSPSQPVAEAEDLVHLGGGAGFGVAELILIAVSPIAALVYGSRGTGRQAFEVMLDGVEAVEFADTYNGLVAAASVEWLAAPPNNRSFAEMTIPPPMPLLTVQDGGSMVSSYINGTPGRRPVRRMRVTDLDDVATV